MDALEQHPVSGFVVVVVAIVVAAVLLWYGHASVRGCEADAAPVPVTIAP